MNVKKLIEELSKYCPEDLVTDGEEEIIVRVIDNQGVPMIESDYKKRQTEKINKMENNEPSMQGDNQYQMMLTAQIDTLTNAYEVVEDHILRLKIKDKIYELVDMM